MSDESTEENASCSDSDAALDLCRYVEDNQPPIDTLVIVLPGAWARFSFDGRSGAVFACDLNDQHECGKIGQVIGRCSTLRRLCVYNCIDDDHNISLATAQCMSALYDGLKESKSVTHLRMYFDPSNEIPVFDLDYFRQYNQCFESLQVHSSGMFSLQQGRLIASQLWKIHQR